jgi:hypothetical protein
MKTNGEATLGDIFAFRNLLLACVITDENWQLYRHTLVGPSLGLSLPGLDWRWRKGSSGLWRRGLGTANDIRMSPRRELSTLLAKSLNPPG